MEIVEICLPVVNTLAPFGSCTVPGPGGGKDTEGCWGKARVSSKVHQLRPSLSGAHANAGDAIDAHRAGGCCSHNAARTMPPHDVHVLGARRYLSHTVAAGP